MQQSYDLNEALIFTVVVEAGSITAAAARLNMQKSTVSRKLVAMEERLGVRLLQRSTRKQTLTSIGEGHYRRCRHIVEAFEEADNILQSHKEEPSGTLSLVLPIEAGQMVLARFLGEFVQRWPKVSLDVELTNRKIDFKEEGIDLALALTPPNDQNLICRTVKATSSVLVASPSFMTGKQITHPEQLAHMNCIQQVTPLLDNQWVFFKGSDTVEPMIGGNLRFNNITALREAAIAGAGLALLPEIIISEALETGKLVQLLPDWQLPERFMYAIYPPRRFMPLALDRLLQEMEEEFEEK